MKTKQLPQGWKEIKLGEIFEIYQPKTISAKELNSEGEYLVFGANGVIGKYDRYNHENEEVLITCRGATCGTINISKPFSWITGNAMVVTPKEKFKKYINKKFLFYLLQGIQIKRTISGSAQPQITRGPLVSFEIYLPFTPEGEPDLKTQQKIVLILEKAEQLKEKRKKSIEVLNEHLKAVFSEMFLKKKFEKVKLGDYSSLVSSGSTPLGGNKNYLNEGEILFIRSQNVLMNKFSNHDKIYISKETHNNMKRTWVKNNDVLLNITGASIGRSAIYSGKDDKANVNQHVCIIRPKKELNSIYLNYYLTSSIIQDYIKRVNAGGTREALNFNQVKNIKIPLPPIELQQQFASIVKHVEKLKEKQKKSQDEIEDLFNALMQKAFQGELVK